MSLADLRSNPVYALQNHFYFLHPPRLLRPVSCVLKGEKSPLSGPFIELKVVEIAGGHDYFFPYTHYTPQGVTANHLRSGAIAITPGMNGCALEVVVKNDQYVFYHDRNGRSMKHVHIKGGIGYMVCRIEAGAYWDEEWATDTLKRGLTPIYQFLCVYKANFWHVGIYRFGITIKNNKVSLGGPGIGPEIRDAYVGYFNKTIRLIRR